VTDPSGAGLVPRAGRTETQLPTVTSVSAAGVISETFVADEKPTEDVTLLAFTANVLPVTEAISPDRWSLPPPLGVGVDPDVVGAVALVVPEAAGCGAEFDVVGDEPQAATDNAVNPIRTRNANPRCVSDAGAVRVMAPQSAAQLGLPFTALMRMLCVATRLYQVREFSYAVMSSMV
jgi:hypothetical protein